MNHRITPTSILAPLLPACDAIAVAHGAPASGTTFELEDTVLRAPPYAWDIGDAAAPLHAQAAQLIADKAAADKAAREQAEADALANPRPWRVSKDTMLERIKAAGKTTDARTLYASQSAADRWDFDNMGWCWNTNARMRGFCTALALDPAAILARDEFLS